MSIGWVIRRGTKYLGDIKCSVNAHYSYYNDGTVIITGSLEHLHSNKHSSTYLAIIHFAIYRWKIFSDAKVSSLNKAQRGDVFWFLD